MVAYNNKRYYIDIVETKPSNAISIIETDCEVDFAAPLDYKEPEKPVAHVPLSKAAAEGELIVAYISMFIISHVFQSHNDRRFPLQQSTPHTSLTLSLSPLLCVPNRILWSCDKPVITL